jgi:NAD(P)-dependent dehydrogenase (short-subunit alcohol dehydrogenase family)
MPPQTALIIGASRGLGLSLVQQYAKSLSPSNVFATVRSHSEAQKGDFPAGVNIIEGVDASKKDCGDVVVQGLKGRTVDHVWVVAGILKPEVSEGSNIDPET